MSEVRIRFWFDLCAFAPRPPALAPEDVAHAFAVEHARHLGTGGFGETWLLGHGRHRQVAKILCDPHYPFDLLRREIEGLHRVSGCPHVVSLKGAELVELSPGRRVALRFEYVGGGDVMDRLRVGRWPSPTETLEFGTGVLQGLVALHECEAVHRDLKPENVALRSRGWDYPVILDLGLSKLLDQPSITVYPAILGTAPYMAPEQVAGQRARKAADLWAVGVILYLLLTRSHPFYDAEPIDQAAALARVRRGALPLTEIDPRLSSLVGRLLAFEPHLRGSARRALKDLRAVRAA